MMNGLIGKMVEWIFYILVFVVSVMIFPTHNIMLWLAFLFSLIFCVPIRYIKEEYVFRVFCFYLSGVLWICGLLLEGWQVTAAYIGTLLIILIVTSYVLLTHLKWRVPHLSADIYQLVLILAFIAGLSTSLILEARIQRCHVIGSFSVVLLLLMIGGIAVAARRSKIAKCVGDIRKFQEKLVSICKEEEKAKLVNMRFEEFLRYVDYGALDYAYVTLSTGLLEIMGVWEDEKLKYPEFEKEKIPFTHDQIRGAIVHSLPRHKKVKSIDKDAAKRLEICNQFKRRPFAAICDLLVATKTKFNSKLD